METDNVESIKKYESLLEMQKILFQFQDNSDNSVDNKLSVFLALCVAIIIGVLSLDNNLLVVLKLKQQYSGIFLIFLAAVSFCYGMHTKKYHDPFAGVDKIKTNLTYSETLKQLLSDCVFATTENNANLKKKIFCYKVGLVLFIFGSIFTSLSLIDTIIIYI